MEYDNVFKKACLIQLTTSNWQGTRMLEQGVMEKLGKSSEWLRGKKYLINPDLLGPIHTSTHQARNLVQQYSLPFPITSIYLIPKESLSLVDERLSQQKEKFHQKVEEFIGIYDQAREEAKEFLGNLFNETDYPIDIRSKFRFEWRFLALELPRNVREGEAEVRDHDAGGKRACCRSIERGVCRDREPSGRETEWQRDSEQDFERVHV